MAESKKGRSRTAGMSMRPIRLGGRSKVEAAAEGGGKTAKAATKPKEKAKAKKDAKEPAATRSPAQARSRASATKPTKKAPAPNMQERMEGLQGWMAEIERKQDRLTRFGGAAAVLALLAAGAALALGILNMQDAATDSDLDDLREQVNGISGTVEQQTEEQLGQLNQSIKNLQTQVQSLQQQQQQNAQTISQLQSRVNSAQAAPSPTPTPLPDTGGRP